MIREKEMSDKPSRHRNSERNPSGVLQYYGNKVFPKWVVAPHIIAATFKHVEEAGQKVGLGER